jgi:uncharacterized protein YbaP (TraB family)
LLKSNSAAELEKMVQIYMAQDLNRINAFVNTMSVTARDELLLRRNWKMTRRMDSLSGLRSHFFAVGAAHLPGTEGVLQLLEEQGYTVQPVFSKKKVAPQNYSYAK